MRKEINILWLDDNAGEDLELMKKYFSSVLEDYGYKTVYISCSNYDEAETKLSDKSIKIDFFVSDFSLEEKRSGLNFLLDIRKKEKYKEFFVLYSNYSKERMRKGVKDLITQNLENVDLFSNYYFFSTGPDFNEQFIKSNFDKIVSLSLIRWDELNALRGEYASINTLLEWVLRRIFYITNHTFFDRKPKYKDYSDCINFLSRKINNHQLNCSLTLRERKAIFTEWADLRKNRNVLEHNIEKWDSSLNDFIIEKTDHSIQFFERDIVQYRKDLINFTITIKRLLDDLFLCNRSLEPVQRSNEYCDLAKGIQ